MILNIESSTGICSVCLSRGLELLSLQESAEPNEHSKVITLLIEQCLSDAGLPLSSLDAIAISEGPGSYTSLRVGFSAAKGLCLALGKPLLTVSTLAALAAAATADADDNMALYCPMIDARRMEVYMALYNARGEVLMPPQSMIVDPASFDTYFAEGRRIYFCGNGSMKCKDVLNNPLATFSGVQRCSSLHLIRQGLKCFSNNNFSNLLTTVPLYIKPPNITSSK